MFVLVELLFIYFGEIVNGVDMCGEVVLLSRNIKIWGVLVINSKIFGGYIKVYVDIEWIINKLNWGILKIKICFFYFNNIVNL